MTETREGSLARLFQDLLSDSGEVEAAVKLLAKRAGLPKRQAEAVACSLGHMPLRYRYNEGTLGCQGQQRLLEATGMVVGLGGLGGYVLEQLARCGTGRIVAADPDRFEPTNLNRQLLADLASIGLSKVEAARRRVALVNDSVEFIGHQSPVEHLPDAVYGCVDLIFDCLDQVPSRLHLEAAATRLNISIIHGAIGGWYGQVAIVTPGSGLLAALYGTRETGIEKSLGNPPFTPALIASLMVSQGIKVLLGKMGEESGIFFIDLLRNTWEFIPGAARAADSSPW
jgi:molybdopterin/thiamine biosynthesis adenylyltransferase